MNAKTISFRDNVGNRHGEIYRSSSIFYVPPTDRVKTTVSLLNYWPLKRSISVAVVASTRTMTGELVDRRRLQFDKGQVENFVPPVDAGFEGSVEIEAFAAENLVIPYAAVIGWYETAKGLSLVHSYARAYSNHEVEEGRILTRGREGCWTIADDERTASFAVAHNGPTETGPQTLTLSVINAQSERRTVSWEIPGLRPYESLKVVPSERIPDLPRFLGGDLGQAEVDFELSRAFTRMLVGNYRKDGQDLQVTHSNFNYTKQPTDMAGPDSNGWMEVPALPVSWTDVVVYPQSAPGRYQATDGSRPVGKPFRTGESVVLHPKAPTTLCFSAAEGDFPTRLVTSIRIGQGNGLIPNECSLGVITKLQPPKRLWWGPLRYDSNARSKIVIHDLPTVYGGITPDATISLRLFSSTGKDFSEVTLGADRLDALSRGIDVAEIWPNAGEFLNGEPGYFTAFSPYGGLTAYTLTENQHGSVSLEHGF